MPFRSVRSTLPPSAMDNAEADLFEELKHRFIDDDDPLKIPGITKLHLFAAAWNQEVAERLQMRDAGEDIVLVRRKSTDQLRRRFVEVNDSQTVAAMPRDEENTVRLSTVFRATRRNLPQPQQALMAPRMQFLPGVTPFGAPAAFNTELMANCFRHSTTPRAPFTITPVNASVRNVMVGFRARRYCCTCGSRKADHVKGVDVFGLNCKRDYCGKCRQMKQYHANSGLRMGPFCLNEPHCQPTEERVHLHWYGDATTPSPCKFVDVCYLLFLLLLIELVSFSFIVT